MKIAPIVLFVYNRLWHTTQTVEAMLQNELAGESDLYIYCDGAKGNGSDRKVKEVRKYVKSIHGFKSVKIIERDKNWGLADSIIDGVSEIVDKYGRVIVIEDDLVTSPFFLTYINNALERYETSEQVMNINGYIFDIENGLPPTFFHQVPSSWGWATWKRAWDKINLSSKDLYNLILPNKQDFDLDKSYDFFRQLKANYDGSLKTWAVKWYATIYLNKGLCLTPCKSFVRNLGFDKDATNTKSRGIEMSRIKEFNLNPIIEDIPLEYSIAEINKIKNFYNQNRDSKTLRVIKWIYFDLLFPLRLMRNRK
jgi:hypothetical protein